MHFRRNIYLNTSNKYCSSCNLYFFQKRKYCFFNFSFHIFCFLVLLFGYGCSHTNTLNPKSNLSNSSGVTTQVKKKAFEPDTLYALLIAEISGYRYQYDTALDLYYKQALKTQDVDIIKRTWTIANFVGNRNIAIEMAELWHSKEPEILASAYALALELMLNGELAQSLDLMISITDKGGQANFELFTGFIEKYSAEERKLTLKRINRTLKRHPNNEQLLLGKTLLHFQNREYKKAIETCDRILNSKTIKGSSQIRAAMIKSRIYHLTNRKHAAIKTLSKILISYPNAIKARLQMVRLQLELNDTNAVHKNLNILFSQGAYDPDIILMISLIAIDVGLYDDANNYLNHMATMPSYQDAANYHLGRLAATRNNWQSSRNYFLRVGASRYFLSAQVYLIQLLIEQKQFELLQQDLESARKTYPDFSEELYLLEAEVLIEQEQYKEAEATLNQAVTKHKNDIMLLYTRAMLFNKTQNLQNMERDLRKILKIDNNNVAALNALGYILIDKTKRLQEGRKLIVKALKIRPNDPAIMDSLGWFEYQMKNYDKAISYLSKAYKEMKDGDVAAHLGEVLWVVGRQADAWDIWSDALQRHPSNSTLKDTLKRFEIQSVLPDLTTENIK